MQKATREHTKFHNKHLITNLIYSNPNISRADISRKSHLTKSTVSEIVSSLIHEGLVIESGQGQSAGGKPPVLLTIEDNAKQIIGIDLATSEFKGILTNLRGEVKHEIRLPINNRQGDILIGLLYEVIEKLIGLATKPILGIGIGSPGLVDSKNGTIINSVNLAWVDLALGKRLKEKYQLPIYVTNDSQVSALAEYTFGEFRGEPNLGVVKISRGVGAGFVINQRIFFGGGFGVGEIGHIKMRKGGSACRCGHYGCLETLISSRAIRGQVREFLSDNPTGLLSSIIKNPQKITFEEISEAYDQNESQIVEFVDKVGVYLGRSIAYLVSMLDVNRFFIAGSVSILGDRLLKTARIALKENCLPILASKTEISISSLGEDTVVLGAVAIVLQNELEIK